MQLEERVCNQSASPAASEGYLHLPWDKSIGVTTTGTAEGPDKSPQSGHGAAGLYWPGLYVVFPSAERMGPVKHSQIKKHTLKEMICY